MLSVLRAAPPVWTRFRELHRAECYTSRTSLLRARVPPPHGRTLARTGRIVRGRSNLHTLARCRRFALARPKNSLAEIVPCAPPPREILQPSAVRLAKRPDRNAPAKSAVRDPDRGT